MLREQTPECRAVCSVPAYGEVGMGYLVCVTILLKKKN